MQVFMTGYPFVNAAFLEEISLLFAVVGCLLAGGSSYFEMCTTWNELFQLEESNRILTN